MTPKPRHLSSTAISRRSLLKAGTGAGLLSLRGTAQAAAADPSSQFIVKPYVQLGDSPTLLAAERMLVLWHAADQDAEWVVEYRDAGAQDWRTADELSFTQVSVEGVEPHRVYRALCHELTPGGEFEYRVRRHGDVAFAATARARRPRSQPVRCAVMGDCGAGSSPQRRIAHQIWNAKPDFVVIPGDFVYTDGRISVYRTMFFPAYEVDQATPDDGAPLLRSIPFLGSLGQHDCGQPLDVYADGFAYFMYWDFPLNGPVESADDPNALPLGGSPERRSATDAATKYRYPRMATFSFDYGDTHWVVLDSYNPQIDWNDSRLRSWLHKDLSETRATWKFVTSYLPPFNSSTAYPQGQKMRSVVDILQETSVDVVFSGFAHSYQRTRPLRFTPTTVPAGPIRNYGHQIEGDFKYDLEFDGVTKTTPEGVIYLTTGGGGNVQLHSPEQTDNPNTWQPYTVRYNGSVNHFSDLQIEGRRLQLRQVDISGTVIDSIVIEK